jgi:nucleoside-diphosphate-sugar epimerase
MKRVLITGGSGFIGRYLIARLSPEVSAIRAVARDGLGRPVWPHNVEMIKANVLDVNAVKAAAASCDTIFHLAGRVHALSEVHSDEALYQSVNVEGTRNVLEGAIAGGARSVVFFSSVKAMGEESDECLDETLEPRPQTAYGRSKLAAEQVVLDYGKRAGLHVVCLRLPLVYGPGNKGNLFRMISAIDRGRFPPLPDVGNRRSMVHVSNVVDAAILAAAHPAANGQCYIVTDRRPYSTRELYEMICRSLGKPIPRWHVPLGALKGLAWVGDVIGRLRRQRFVFDSDALEKLTGSAWYSSEKIARELGFRPKVAFEDTLPEMIDWYRKTRA